MEEYQRRRLELEQRQQGIVEQARQLGVSVERHDELAGMVQLIETFCQGGDPLCDPNLPYQ